MSPRTPQHPGDGVALQPARRAGGCVPRGAGPRTTGGTGPTTQRQQTSAPGHGHQPRVEDCVGGRYHRVNSHAHQPAIVSKNTQNLKCYIGL